MLDITIETQTIRIGSRFAVSFQRTLRIPDDGRSYPLPPGLGMFPIFRVEEYRDQAPPEWGGGEAFIPMYQREALWLGFTAAEWKPNAAKVAVGGVNAISGEPDNGGLHAHPQNYIVCPDQPWLDGIKTGAGSVRQFVAMPLGLGYTIEASVTGSEQVGGIQITAFEPKPGLFPDEPPRVPPSASTKFNQPKAGPTMTPMGLGAGGVMKQKIYLDPHGIETWDQDNYGHVVIHIVNSAQFREITGIDPPSAPVDAHTYTEHGLPWFDLYDETRGDVAPSERLAEAKTIAERDRERGESAEHDASVDVPESQITKLQTDTSQERRASSSPRSKKPSPQGG